MAPYQLQRKVNTVWSRDLAYAIGLITADGNLSRDGRHIGFVSSERELVENLRKALSLQNKIGKGARGGETEKKYFIVQFGDKAFYQFLNELGLTSAKSKTIESVKIPDQYFGDFLRGLFDGDGTFYTFWDRRWPSSFGYQVAFTSASPNFINWLKLRLAGLYSVKGFIHRGSGVLNLRYVKGDSRKIFETMYCNKNNILFLKRKYFKMVDAFRYDASLRTYTVMNMPG